MTLNLNMFVIAIRLQKCVRKLLIDVFFAFIYILDQYETQEMFLKILLC